MCCVLAVFGSVLPGTLGSSYRDRQYLNEWAVEIPGGLAAAEAVAKELEYELVQQVSEEEDQITLITIIMDSMCPNEVDSVWGWGGTHQLHHGPSFMNPTYRRKLCARTFSGKSRHLSIWT